MNTNIQHFPTNITQHSLYKKYLLRIQSPIWESREFQDLIDSKLRSLIRPNLVSYIANIIFEPLIRKLLATVGIILQITSWTLLSQVNVSSNINGIYGSKVLKKSQTHGHIALDIWHIFMNMNILEFNIDINIHIYFFGNFQKIVADVIFEPPPLITRGGGSNPWCPLWHIRQASICTNTKYPLLDTLLLHLLF